MARKATTARKAKTAGPARRQRREAPEPSLGIKTSADPLPYTAAAISPAPGAILYEDFAAMARDHTVPERELRPYITIDRALSRPFRPAMHLDPALVRKPDNTEIRAEGAMDWANGLSRWRRQERFRWRTGQGDKSPVPVSEGDSWFQFPILLDDVIDQLDSGYRVWSVDAAGDTLDNMVRRFPEYLAALKEHTAAKAFLFSGGGNDLVGEDPDGRSMLEKVLKPFKAGQSAAWHVGTEEYKKTLNTIDDYFRDILARVAKEFPGLPVIIHRYDYSIPGPAPGEWRNPWWAGIDQWLGRAMRARGILDHALQRNIVKTMIDDLNMRQIQFCGNGEAVDGKFKDAYHVDVRGTLKDRDWADELHPTDAGFRKVANRFRDVLSKVVR